MFGIEWLRISVSQLADLDRKLCHAILLTNQCACQ